MILDFALLPHQAEFVEDKTTRNLCLVGGYGAGKTKALATKLIFLSFQNAGYEGIALSPTYGMSQKVLVPEIEDQLTELGIKYKFNKANLVFDIRTPGGYTKLHVLAAESYKRAAGINAAFFGIDEADLIAPDVARAAWQMLSSRLRKGLVYQGCAVSTPEGFSFLYDYFVEEVKQKPELAASRRIIHAKTEDNPYLPPEYIADLRSIYPPHLLRAYLDGEFVNLNGMVVYQNFDKTDNHAPVYLKDVLSTETLHIGMDFNVSGMSAIACVIRGQDVIAVDELIGAMNTQSLCDDIAKRYAGMKILVHPDPACTQRKTSTTDTDLAVLLQNAIPVRRMSAHPLIRDRVNSVNALFLNGLGDRRLKVNTHACPLLTKSLLAQTYDSNGKPKKDIKLAGANNTDASGPLDALGYFVYANFPLRPVNGTPLRLVGT